MHPELWLQLHLHTFPSSFLQKSRSSHVISFNIVFHKSRQYYRFRQASQIFPTANNNVSICTVPRIQAEFIFHEITGGAWSWTGLQAFHHFQWCCMVLGNQPLFPAGRRWWSVSCFFFLLFQIRRVVSLQAKGRCFYSAEQQAQMTEQTRQAALSRSAAAPAKRLGLMAEIQFGQSKDGTPWPGMVSFCIRRRLEMAGNIFILAQQVK